MSDLNKEIWTGEMIKGFRQPAEGRGWRKPIPKANADAVKAEKLHFNLIGADPTVVVNQTTYPLTASGVVDSDKVVSLDKFETNPSKITDDEVRTLSYDKVASVIERHKLSIDDSIHEKGLWNIAPQTHSADSPVYQVGANQIIDGILKLKKFFDDNKVPRQGRILVLCSEHAMALCKASTTFDRQYNVDHVDGLIGKLYGFNIYESTETPYYANGTKKAFGAVISNEKQSSIAFYSKAMIQAEGSIKMYFSKAEDNPLTKENIISFTKWETITPVREAKSRATLLFS